MAHNFIVFWSKLGHYSFNFVFSIDLDIILLCMIINSDGKDSKKRTFLLASLIIKANLKCWWLISSLNNNILWIFPFIWISDIFPCFFISFIDLDYLVEEKGHVFQFEFDILTCKEGFENVHLFHFTIFWGNLVHSISLRYSIWLLTIYLRNCFSHLRLSFHLINCIHLSLQWSFCKCSYLIASHRT